MHVRPQPLVDSALAASDRGVRDADNAVAHGVAVKTIRRWRRDYQRRGLPRGQQHTSAPCPRCTGAPMEAGAYAELLGWYLGDGYLSLGRRQVYNLHIYNDVRYSRLNGHIADLMRIVKPGGRPHRRTLPGCLVHCLLEALALPVPAARPRTQARAADRPRAVAGADCRGSRRGLPAGLFHSDGSRVANWTTRVVAGEIKRYDYPRWMFTNSADDIIDLCTRALDRVGVAWRRPRVNCVAVSRAAGVARLDELIGPKA